MKIDKSSFIRTCIVTFVSFILCLCIFALSICTLFTLSLKEKSINYVFKKSDYSLLAFDSLHTDLADLTIPSGLPIDFFKDKLDFTLFNARVQNTLSHNLTGDNLVYSIEQVQKEFFDWSYAYASTETNNMSSEAVDSLQEFSKECAVKYIKYINPSALKYLFTAISVVQRYLVYALIFTSFLTVASGVFLYFLCRHRDFAKYIYFSFIGSALLLGLPSALLIFTEETKKIGLTSPSLYSLTITYIDGLLSVIFALSLLIFIGLIIFSILRLLIRKRKEQR